MKRGELSLNTERVRLQAELTLEFKLVLAARSKLSLSLRSTGIDNSVKYSTAFAAAFWNDWAMVVGWIPAQHQKGQFRENQEGLRALTERKDLFRSSQQTSCQDDNRCRSVSCFNILRG